MRNQFSLIADFYDLNAANSQLLFNYAQKYSEGIFITGEGSLSKGPTTSVDGMTIANNYILAHHAFVHVSAGQLNISEMNNNGVDSTPLGFLVDNYGVAPADQINGGIWLCNDNSGTVTNLGAVAIYSNPNGGGGGAPSNVQINGLFIPFSQGSSVEMNDSKGGSLKITGSRLLGAGSGGNHAAPAINFSANGTLEVVGSALSGTGQNYGIIDNGAAVLQVTGNFFNSFNLPVYITQPGTKAVTGNAAVNSTTAIGNASVNGPYGATAVQAGNSWDKGPAITHMIAANGQPDQINCDGAAASIGCQIIAKGAGLTRFFSGGGSQQVLQVGSDGGGSGTAIISAGGGTTFSGTMGNTNINAGSGGYVAVKPLLPCNAAPSGYICSQGAGAAVIVKP